MQCNHCNFELAEGARFCPECGKSAATTMACRHCGEVNPIEAKFCPNCGKSSSDPVASSAIPAPTVAPSSTSTDFVYALTEESVRKGEPDRAQPPYGAVAVCMVDNSIYKIFGHEKYQGNNKNNEFKDLFGRLKENLLGLAGQKTQKVSNYILADLSNLPLVTHRMPVQVVGKPEASLHFEFWISPAEQDLNLLGLFIQKFVSGKKNLTLSEFKQIAIEQLNTIASGFDFQNATKSPEMGPAMARELSIKLKQATGISSNVVFKFGNVGRREWLDVTKAQKAVHCDQCGAAFTQKIKFCGSCGNDMSDAAKWVNAVSYLQAKTGEQITIRMTMMVDNSDPNIQIKLDERASEYVLNVLAPKLRQMSVPELMTSSCLSEFSQLLNKQLTKEWLGYISDFAVTDIRTAEDEWFFKTDALVSEALREVEANKKFLAVDSAEIDFKELTFALELRKVQQGDSEALTLRRTALEARIKETELEVQEHALETQTSLRKENIEDDAEKQRLARDKEKMLRERDFQREATKGAREDEITDVDHDFTLEKKAASHDIDLADMTGEAQSRANRRGVSDDVFRREEDLRLDAKKAEGAVDLEIKREGSLGHIKEDLEDRQSARQIEKLRAMAEMEANMAKQDGDLELAKRDAMKNLSAAEMLAMQVAELAKVNGGQSAADIVKAIADSQAASAGVGIKEEMYEKMLAMQEKANQSAIDAHKSAAEIAQSTNEKSMQSMMEVAKVSASQSTEGYKEAAKIAQSTNEKSMESMSKVATATAGRKNGNEKESSGSEFRPACSKCGFDKNKLTAKFCGSCGDPQTND
jgi:RNA polymerase subunit RPABC4/transcription elongation factor Spt4